MNRDFLLQAELFSEKLKTTELVTLTFSSPPITFQEIKDRIEECCCIPVCVQTLYYQSNEVLPNCSPISLYIRSGDTIHVSYPVKGETKRVLDVVEWLRQSSKILGEIRQLKQEAMVDALENNAVLSDSRRRNFSRALFCPYSNPVKYVNSVYFTFLGGVKLLTDFHHHAIALRKENLQTSTIGYFEQMCCQACADYSMYKECAVHLSQSGELENCMATFLRKKADDNSLIYNNEYSTIDIALCAIFNITELPDMQLKIVLSLRRDVIDQCFLAGYSSMYNPSTSISIISFFVSLSRCPRAHENLLEADLVEGIVGICQSQAERRSYRGRSINVAEVTALKSYAGVVFAQIVCGSSHLLQSLPQSTLEKMKALICEVCAVDPSVIRNYETEQEFYWETFVDCVQYLYIPTQSADDLTPSSLIKELHHHSIEMLLHYLQNTLGRSIHVEIIVKENLLDYITALPWIVPVCFKERANCVLKEILNFQPIQPPSLSSIAKVSLAKSKFGLRNLMEATTISELAVLF